MQKKTMLDTKATARPTKNVKSLFTKTTNKVIDKVMPTVMTAAIRTAGKEWKLAIVAAKYENASVCKVKWKNDSTKIHELLRSSRS